MFKKRESHLVTFRSGQHSSQIDFILARRKDRRDCLDCKVIPGECVVPQHKLVLSPILREQSGGSLELKRHKRLRK